MVVNINVWTHHKFSDLMLVGSLVAKDSETGELGGDLEWGNCANIEAKGDVEKENALPQGP